MQAQRDIFHENEGYLIFNVLETKIKYIFFLCQYDVEVHFSIFLTCHMFRITKKIRHDIWSESLVNDVRKIENMDIARLLWIKNIYCLFVCLFVSQF
jgi:hypothetical protein